MADPQWRQSESDVLATPDQRKAIWATIGGFMIREGRFDLARQAIRLGLLDDPPREWPHDALPARVLRGEATFPPVAWPKRVLGWLLWKVTPSG